MKGRFGPLSHFAVALVIFAGFSLSIPQFSKAETWRVIQIKPSGRLHVRARATSRSRVVGYLRWDARGVEGRRCIGNWCEIDHNGLQGWVYKRYLKRDKRPAPKREPETKPETLAETVDIAALASKKIIRLKPSEGRPRAVYMFPDEDLPVAGSLPAGTNSVEGLGSCLRQWCYVRNGRLIGWMPVTAFALDQAAESETTTAALPQDSTSDASDAGEDTQISQTGTTETSATIVPDIRALANPPRSAKTRLYALAGLPENSSLSLLDQPSGEARILARIPHDARNITGLKTCDGKWCLVQWKTTQGWIPRRHLVDESVEGSEIFQVTGLPVWSPLEVLDQPDEDGAVVGAIPSFAIGVTPIGACNRSWCHVRYLGLAGWVRGQYLTSQKRPAQSAGEP